MLIGGAAADGAVGVADHRRRRGGRLRGLGARRDLRDPRRVHAVRVMGRRARIVRARGARRRRGARGRRLRRAGSHRRRRAAAAAPAGHARGRRRRRPRAPDAGTRCRAPGSFVGYRVNERYLGVGVRTAVGRTSAVTGERHGDGDRVEAADLRADMTTVALRPGAPRRHPALPRASRPTAIRARASRSRARWRSAPAPGGRPAR